MIEVDDGYAAMPKAPRPAAPTPPVAPPSVPVDDTPPIPTSQPKPNQPAPRLPSAPAPEPRPVQRPEYVDDTLDIPRGGRASARFQQFRNGPHQSRMLSELAMRVAAGDKVAWAILRVMRSVDDEIDSLDASRAGHDSQELQQFRSSPVAFRPFTELAVAASSGNGVAQSLLQVMQYEPGLYQRFVRSASDRQKALTALFADAGLVEEWDEEVLSILEASSDRLSSNPQVGDSVSQQTLDQTAPPESGDWTVNISLGPKPDAITWALYLLDETFFSRVEPSDFTRSIQLAILNGVYGVELTSSMADGGPYAGWSPQAVNEVYHGVAATAWALSTYEGEVSPSANLADPGTAFRTTMGPVEMHLSPAQYWRELGGNWEEMYGERIETSALTTLAYDAEGNPFYRILVFPSRIDKQQNQQQLDWFEYNVGHELGHVFANQTYGIAADWLTTIGLQPSEGWGGRLLDSGEDPFTRQSRDTSERELFADQLLFWAYGSFGADWASQRRDLWMDDKVGDLLDIASLRNLTAAERYGRVPVLLTAHTGTTENLNIRSAPFESGTPLGSIPYGTQVEALGIDLTGQWVVVTYRGRDGWVSAALLQGDKTFLSLIAPDDIDRASGRSR